MALRFHESHTIGTRGHGVRIRSGRWLGPIPDPLQLPNAGMTCGRSHLEFSLADPAWRTTDAGVLDRC